MARLLSHNFSSIPPSSGSGGVFLLCVFSFKQKQGANIQNICPVVEYYLMTDCCCCCCCSFNHLTIQSSTGTQAEGSGSGDDDNQASHRLSFVPRRSFISDIALPYFCSSRSTNTDYSSPPPPLANN